MPFLARFVACICFLLLFVACPMVSAQHVVHGKIVDKYGVGLSYAAILQQRLPDSVLVQTFVADSAGYYHIEVAETKNTVFCVLASGFVTGYFTVADATVTDMKKDVQLNDAPIALKEVAVSSRKSLIERKVDRVVFNVESSISSIGGDALEAIGKAPGVKVSGSDDISMAGKGSVSVMIDDKLIQLSGDELSEMLRAIPADNISRIEVITTPPARYDAAGNSGIINVVTKKSKKQGLNGSIGVTYMQNSLASLLGTGAFNYRKDKLNIYGNSNGGNSYSRPTERQAASYTGQQWNQISNVDNLYNYHRSQLGADYNITPHAIIGVLYTYGGSKPGTSEEINGWFTNIQGGIDSVISTRAKNRDFGERNVVNVNYEWKIDTTGKKLNIDGDYFTRTGISTRDFSTVNSFGDGIPTGISSDNRTTGKQVLYIGSGKADVELPTTFAKLSFGAKASFIHVLSDNIFSFINGGKYQVDPGKTNQFDYTENTQALYTSAQKKLNMKWDAQAGIRAEYTQTTALSKTMNSAVENRYLQLFPTAYVQYTPSEDHVFNINVSRRIERPNMSMINPFRRYVTPNSYDEGNPFLKPSFTSGSELSYTLKSNYNFTVFVQHARQTATQVLELDSVNKGMHFRYANIGTSLNYGASAGGDFTPVSWWECNVMAYGYNATVAANYYNNSVTDRYQQWSFYFETDNTFTLNKDKTLLAELGLEYNSKTIETYNVHFPNYNLNAGVKALFFKRNLIVACNVNDMLATQIIKSENLYNGSSANNYYDSRMLHLTITYKFGNKNIKAKRDRTGGAVEESKRT